MKRAYVEVYGCAYAQAEGEMIRGMLSQLGFLEVTNPEGADLIVIVTCHVKEATEQKILHRIKSLGEKYPEKNLIVYGCLPQAYPEKVRNANPKASLLGNLSLHTFPECVKKVMSGERIEALHEIKKPKLGFPRGLKNKVIGIVPIAEGCAGACAYCSTRFSRRKIFSFPEELILEEIKAFLKAGCKEIWLTAQDTAAYGLDTGSSLPELLRKICTLEGKFFVRVGMMNPALVKKMCAELIEAFECEKIYKFLHIPVQSGSNKILKFMRRGYKVEEFIEMAKAFRSAFPMLQLWTDLIVGFPQESEQDFEKTKELIIKIKPDWVNISRFSVRDKTEAAKMKQVSTEIKKARSKELSEIVGKVVEEVNQKWVNWEGIALVSEKGKEGVVARNFAYKPIVLKKSCELLGKFVKVRIVNAKNVLFGEVIGVLKF